MKRNGTASAGSDSSGELAELRGQVATLQESLESRNLENEELRERVRLLESQLENAQRLVEIESEELAAAQQQAAQAQQAAEAARAQALDAQEQAEQQAQQQAQAGTQAAASPETETQPSEAQAVQPVEEAGQESVESSSVAEEPEVVADAGSDSAAPDESQGAGDETQTAGSPDTQEPETDQQASAAAGSQSAQSGESTERVRTVSSRDSQGTWWAGITDMLFSSWMWMVGVGLGVLVLVLGLLMFLRRRQSIAEFEESILSGSALDSYSETTDTAATSASDTSFLSDFGTAGMGTMQADEVDPLAEAEVYLAYGRDEQAEDVLKEAARRDPGRAEVKLKLLEIYKQRNDVKAFETIAEELYPAGDSGDREVWNQVAAMGRELSPGNPLFQEGAAGADTGGETPAHEPPPAAPAAGPASAAAAADELNFDFDAPDQATGQTAAAPASTSGGSAAAGDDLDLDLDIDMTPDEPQRPAQAPAAAARDESVLDFGEEFLEQPAASVDPATQPFPAPDEQTDLDRELERLAGERESAVAPAAASGGAESAAGEETPSLGEPPAWEKAEPDAGTLDFPTSDNSDIDFDLDLDDNSIQQLSGGDTPDDASEPQAAAGQDNDSLSVDTDDTLLEFESENIPPEETWAGPSSDMAPGSNGSDEAVAYAPEDDVQSAAAPQYNEAETKLDLARAYLDMGDKVGARSIIDEVMREGDPAQRDQAAELASQL